ncbi:MAG: carboxypeptidase regulatory-like domain-containing protein [Candidatus Cloacimonetes bacterium]|nr:carboxypeptidase regulatory-like domain-containing protein [Candidatus Cloacimonadota bacterium]
MRKSLLFTLLLILGISFCSNVFALVTVTLGEGTATNTTTGTPTPYGTYYKNFRQQYLVRASELNDVGGGAGNINSIAFNVATLNTCSPMPNYRIRIKTTTQTVLATTFEVGTYQEVFQNAMFMPVVGWNTHTFSTPFAWDGTSNLLIDIVTDLITGTYTQNASVPYTLTSYNSASRFQSDSSPAVSGTTGTLSMMRANMQFVMQALDITDMKAVAITGPTTPNVNSTANYTVSVKNYSLTAMSNYTVKLMKTGGVEIASVAGTSINPQQTLEFTLPWVPTVVGETQLYGKVVMTGDQNPANDETAMLTVTVMEAGLLVAEIGNGTTTNTNLGAPAPYGTFYKAFRQQLLYTAADFYAAGAAPGLISSLAFNVLDIDTCSPMPNYTIRFKNTAQQALGTTFEAGEYTTVWHNDLYMPTAAWNMHSLIAPFFWDGTSNLLVDITTDMIAGTWTHNAMTTMTPTAYNSSLRFQSDTANGSTGTTGTAAMDRTNVRFFMLLEDMGSLSGTVSVSGTPLAGATVKVEGTVFETTSGADGTYSMPHVPVGVQQVSATKHGYTVVTHSVTVVEDQASTQNFAIALLPQVTVTGKVVGSDNPTLGIAGATVALTGYEPYTATTNATGNFTITGVFASQTYNYNVSTPGYQPATGQVVVGTTDVNMNNITVNEIANPASGVVATEATDFTNVGLSWNAPGAGTSEWIHYDSGENDDSIGTGGAADFDVAIRYPASALTAYAGTSLQAVKVWPNEAAGTYAIRVWTGGTPTAPGTMVVDQAFTPTIAGWNTINLTTPVPITGTEELWFGYRCNVTTGYPAGCDAGPALNGTANMMYWQSAWTTLLALSADLNYNWNIQGFVGYAAPTGEAKLTPLTFNADRQNTGDLAVSGIKSAVSNSLSKNESNDRTLMGYRVWRLLASDQANEAAWTSLTTANITTTSYTDNTWQPLPSGVYKYAVKAVYTNGVFSVPSFSNSIDKGMMGVLTGTITEFGTSLPIAGVTVAAGTYTGTTNASGVYSFGVYAGTYNVTAVKGGYQPASQAGVVVVGLQTTTQNFVMTELTLPPTAVMAAISGSNANITWSSPGSGPSGFVDDFESYADFTLTFAPWTLVDVDLSTTYGFSGITFPNSGAAMAYIIFNPTTTVPVLDHPAHSGNKMAACFAATTAPNNDWMISPQVTVMPGDHVNFWAQTYMADYGLERFKVGVSTTGTAPANFTFISGASYVSAPIDWTSYSYDLSAYTGQQVYVGIQCISNDAFIFFVDDFSIGAPEVNKNYTQTSDEKDYIKTNISTQNIGTMTANERKQYNPATGIVSIQPSIDLSSIANADPSRALTGYKVWRLIAGQETNETGWTSLTTNPISATAYQDGGWGALPDGTYKWAVKAVYTGGALSIAGLSNPLTKMTQVGTIDGIVRNQQQVAISGATVTSSTYTATTNAQGAYSLTVPAGTHSVTATHPNYAPSTQAGVIVVTGSTTTVNFNLAPSTNLLVDGFETYTDFALTFAPWTCVDVDLSTTYGFSGISFLNSGAAMAYIVFNPATTTPAATTIIPHGGAKMAASFAATAPPNNDWLITPQLTGATQIKFWAKSHMADYGLERFKVGVSTTGTAPADFTIISGASYIEAPIEWTEYTYNITTGNVPVYIGIQCLSNDAFIFFVDDVTVMGGGSANEDPIIPVIATELKGNYPNPFNPETTISFNMKETAPVSLEIYNVKGQLVKTMLNGVQEMGNHSVVWNGKDNNGRAVSSGVYYYKMNTGSYSSTMKMIMMK